MKKILFSVMGLFVAFAARADVVINEVQSSNDQTLLDDRQESPDWVELWNGEDNPVDISGWVLTDKANKPEKWWKFPQGTVIDPGEHLVVYADSTGLEDEAANVDPLAPDADELKDSLVAWYGADTITSLESGWTDQSDNGFVATKNGSPTLVTEDETKAVSFSSKAATKQYFTVPTTASGFTDKLDNLSDVTVIVVGKWSGTVNGSYVGLFGVTHGKTSDNTCLLLGSDGTLRMQYSSSVRTKSSAVMPRGEWAAAAFTTQKEGLETAKTKLYLNGECVVEGTPSAASYSTALGSSSKMYLGAAPYGGSTISYFDGQIAEVIIYNRALSAAEYAAVFKSLNAKYGLTGGAKTAHHTSFSIGASGETLTLMSADGGYTNAVTFGKIPCDCSYGRVGDGSGTWAWFADPTPKSANTSDTYESPLDPVVFSRERGIVADGESVTVELTHPDPEAEIHYTLDRSEPTESSPRYTGPITFSKTTIVRATAVKEGHLPYRNVATHSYIWLGQVADQTTPSDATITYPSKWTDTGSTVASYGISSLIVKDTATRQQLVDALKAIPIVSVTMPDGDLFDTNNGLYTKPNTLEDVERQADVEWVTGDEVFGLGCGLEMHGAYSRRFDTTPKKSLKLKFSGAYGGSLDHNVLASGGGTAVEYKKLVLRGENNHSWTSMERDTTSTPGGGHPELGQSMVDQFFRSTQKAMSGFQAEGTHVHLFLNGMYWGLYNLTDHVCDAFAASTFCTDTEPKDRMDLRKNFDVIKTSDEVRDGTATAFNAIKNDIGTSLDNAANYAAMSNRFDYAAYIDMLLIQWFAANEDWPGNNWVVAGSDKLGIPFRYVLWDTDKTVNPDKLSLDLTTKTDGAMSIHSKLKSKTEYKLMFADRIQRHLIAAGGALTVDEIVKRYLALAAKVETYVFAESARWGAYIYENWDALPQKPQTTKFASPFDLSWWANERDRLTKEDGWFAQRHATLLTQLRNAGFWSDAFANVPTILTNAERQATLVVPAGAKAYYTLDGSDPHQFAATATKSATAVEYAGGETIELPEEGGVLKARVLSGTTWSALSELPFESAVETRNVLVAPKKDAVWDDDASWSLGYYPNEPGAIAILGVPDKVSKKFNRKVAISNETGVTVGHIEITNDTEKYNVIASFENADESMFGGDLTFCGGISDDGATTNDATLAVLDTAGTGYAKISLEAPNAVVRLASDLDVTVSNVVGHATYGGLLIEGAIAGDGHNLAKWGPGKMTLAVTNAADDVLGNIQCNEGIVAVEAPLHITSVTKETGTIWLKLGGTDAEAAFASALVCDDKLNKTHVALFVPTTIGSDTESFYGGAFCAAKLSPADDIVVYVQDADGDVTFCGETWSAHEGATVSTKGKLTVDGVEYKTFKVDVPYFGPTYELRYEPGAGVSGEPVVKDLAPFAEHTVIACPFTNGDQPFTGWRGPDGKTWQPGAVVSNLTETGSSVAFTAMWFGITVGDRVFASVQEAVNAANSATPLVFSEAPSVTGRTITANGESATVKDFYDIEASEDGKALTLVLNDTVKAEANTYTVVTWKKGKMKGARRAGFMTRAGFWYALGQGGEAKTKWLKGDGTPQAIEPPEEGEWDVLVSDVER